MKQAKAPLQLLTPQPKPTNQREGILAGLGPFIDTLVVCTITALVILASGAWNRGPEGEAASTPVFQQVEGGWQLSTVTVSP